MVRGRDHVETDNFAHVDYVTAALAGRFTMVETMKVSQQDYQTRVLATARMYRLIGDLVGLGSLSVVSTGHSGCSRSARVLIGA